MVTTTVVKASFHPASPTHPSQLVAMDSGQERPGPLETVLCVVAQLIFMVSTVDLVTTMTALIVVFHQIVFQHRSQVVQLMDAYFIYRPTQGKCTNYPQHILSENKRC